MDDSRQERPGECVLHRIKCQTAIHSLRTDYLSASFNSPSLVLLGLSFVPSLLYVFLPGAKKSVFVINTLALSFAHNALSTIKLDTFWTGLILLSGLFFYDVWWVFGTEVVSFSYILKLADGMTHN